MELISWAFFFHVFFHACLFPFFFMALLFFMHQAQGPNGPCSTVHHVLTVARFSLRLKDLLGPVTRGKKKKKVERCAEQSATETRSKVKVHGSGTKNMRFTNFSLFGRPSSLHTALSIKPLSSEFEQAIQSRSESSQILTLAWGHFSAKGFKSFHVVPSSLGSGLSSRAA